MEYVILDLEWNQSSGGPSLRVLRERKRWIHGEIIEIGAVKINEKAQVLSTFRVTVKPQFLKVLKRAITELTGITALDIAKGQPFNVAAERFRRWAGDAPLLTWGQDDRVLWEENCFIHRVPLCDNKWIDAQLFYSDIIHEDKRQRSLSAVLEDLEIETQNLDAHNALNDSLFVNYALEKTELLRGRTLEDLLAYEIHLPCLEERDVSSDVFDGLKGPSTVWKTPELWRVQCPHCRHQLHLERNYPHAKGRRIARAHCFSCDEEYTVQWRMTSYGPNKDQSFLVLRQVFAETEESLKLYRYLCDQWRKEMRRRREMAAEALEAEGKEEEYMERSYAWESYNEQEFKELRQLSQSYMQFLDRGKTERECVEEAVAMAERRGYKNLEDIVKKGGSLKPGDKVYAVKMKKSLVLFNIGSEDIERGMNILGAHIDSPRIDVKQNPMYEDSQLAYFDTHYYGGIKKYQWVAMPLAIHGVVAKKDGTVITINIGEDDGDPVFCITDLLPHLGQEQMEKKANKVIEGEKLDLLIGSRPMPGQTKQAVIKALEHHFQTKYGFGEEDLMSAELEIVPAGKARDMGFDRSMILAYGQDDRVCAYTSLIAMLDVEKVKRTTCCLLVDKEEIGSYGATGMQSRFFENAVAEVCELLGKGSNLQVRRSLERSTMLSSDVSAGYDPLFASAFEKKNTSFLGKGVVFNKFTGARGKSGSNDANAEYMAYVRQVMDDANVVFQTAELGRVDLGGGGTIAFLTALYGMNVIDCGVAVLSMHAPWEVTSKADIYEAKKCYVAFLRAKGM